MANSKSHILAANLARLDQARASILEKTLAHIGELAEHLCDEADEEEIFFRDEAFAAKYRAMTNRPMPPVAEINQNRVSVQEKSLSAMERAMMLCRLCDTLGICGLQGAGTFFDEPADVENEIVSYMKSSYADTAYRAFTETMTDPKVLYGHDFAEVCENVYYGRCAYCILPVENSIDGRLAGFRGLIMKYGLKIITVCQVEDSAAESHTLFALLKKNMVIPTEESEGFFEFCVETSDLHSLISGAEACGMHLISISSVPGGAQHYDMVMQICEEGFCGFLSLLHLEYPSFIPIGMFGERKNLERNYHDR